ncbi:MAG: S8 family peptidase [Chloroflexota bacterium]|nr:S8 family peptidase [Chloroflexota bacterium]
MAARKPRAGSGLVGGTAGGRRPLMEPTTVIEPLLDPAQRSSVGMPEDEQSRGPVVVELNVRHAAGLPGASERFEALWRSVASAGGASRPEPVGDTYVRCELSVDEMRALVARDREAAPAQRAIYRIWPDFPVKAQIDQSVATIKADAARRAFAAAGAGVVWAVVDSGIDATHPHFRLHRTLQDEVAGLHRDFTARAPDKGQALNDSFGHGTHVAGVLAGGLPERLPRGVRLKVGQRAAQSLFGTGSDGGSDTGSDTGGDGQELFESVEEREVAEPGRLTGVAPACKLVSLKVLDDEGNSRSTDVLRALQYIREEVNGNGKVMRIHGVNLSLGYEFNARWFACGQSPLCAEVDRLVRSGVVVVAAAGNTGYGRLTTPGGFTDTALAVTINDPGNAALAITVGATHRALPYTYGVSYFSSKGPTGDGRRKPDLVAPGERITSAAAGQRLAELWGARPPKGAASYLDDSGTSLAAPHVSGAVAAFLSVRREFVGRPEEVKRLFLEHATPLGRDPHFEGHGLLDLMRVLQAV